MGLIQMLHHTQLNFSNAKNVIDELFSTCVFDATLFLAPHLIFFRLFIIALFIVSLPSFFRCWPKAPLHDDAYISFVSAVEMYMW